MGERNYNGESTFYYSETLKRYIGQFTDPSTGKRKSISDVSEKKAKAKLRKALFEAENGKYIQSSSISVAELAKELIILKQKTNIHNSNSHLRSLETLKK